MWGIDSFGLSKSPAVFLNVYQNKKRELPYKGCRSHLGSSSVMLGGVLFTFVEVINVSVLIGCLSLRPWEDFELSAEFLGVRIGFLCMPGGVSVFSSRVIPLESISTTCVIEGRCCDAAWVQKSATLMKRNTSSPGYSTSSGSTISKSLFSSRNFHVCIYHV